MNAIEKNYWNTFYKDTIIPREPSPFALFINNYFNTLSLNILDCGCGNGRDSYYFANKHTVLGIDTSCKPNNTNNCSFIVEDFCKFNKEKYNLVYSRFTFHSITNEQQNEFIKSIKKDTYLCIETRSDKSKDINKVHGDTHYRNYTNIDYLEKLLKKNNFKIIFLEEKNGFAKYKDEDPYCIRLIAKKN